MTRLLDQLRLGGRLKLTSPRLGASVAEIPRREIKEGLLHLSLCKY